MVELRLGPPEGGRDLLQDLPLEGHLRLIDVEAGTKAIEIGTLVPPILQLGNQSFPGRLAHRLRLSTGGSPSREQLPPWYLSACARTLTCLEGRHADPCS